MDNFLRQVIDAFPGMVFIKNTEGIYINCSEAFAKFAGFNSPEEVIGKTTFEVLPKTSAQWAIRLDRLVFETGQSNSEMYPFKFENNNYTNWQRVSRKPLRDNDGNLVGLVGTLEDVGSIMALTDELGESKARFTALSETMDYNSFVVILWNADNLNADYVSGNIGYLNVKTNKLTHMYDWAENIHPDDADSFWEQRKPLTEQATNVDFWHEYRVINKSGEIRWVNERVSFVTVPGSKLYRSIIIDTTARHEHDNLESHVKHSGGSMSGDIILLDIVSREFLQELSDSVSKALGVTSFILDPTGLPLTKRDGHCELCDLIESSEKGLALCNFSNSNLCIAARDTGGMVVEPCETAGLYNAAAPIIVSGKMLGVWVVGQVRVKNTIDENNIKALSKKISIDEKAALDAFNAMPERGIKEAKQIFSLLEPYVEELSEYVHRSYLLMHEAERMVKSQELVTKSLKIENLQNELYDIFFNARYSGDNSRFHDALEAISGYYGFNRAMIIRLSKNKFEPLYQWQEPGRAEFSPLQLDNEALGAVYNFCAGSSAVRYIGKDQFPSSWSSDLYNLGINDCYLYSVENKGKSVGLVGLMQGEDRPKLSPEEMDSLTNVLGTLGAYMIMKHLEQRMRETTESLHLILNNLRDSIYVVDRTSYEVVFANTNFDGKNIIGSRGVACYRLLGYDSPCSCCGLDMLKDQPNGYSYSFETDERDLGLWHSVTMTVMEWLGGRPVYLVNVRDITEEKLRQQQFVDALTFDPSLNIPNIGRLTTRLDALNVESENGFLFIIDIDNIRLINNAYGHEYGDALLKEVTAFLKSYMPRGEYVYRYATKTFAVLYEGADKESADKFVKSLYDRFSLSWRIKDKICYATFSAAMVPYGSGGAAVILRNADIALERSIDRARNSFYALIEIFRGDHVERLELANDLHAMVNNGCNELVIHYQPVYDVKKDSIVHMEALMRWDHPKKGIISPLKFIELAEDASLIGPLSEKMIETAVAQCKIWQEKNPNLKLSVNFSAAHSRQEGIVSRISRILRENEFNPRDFIVEINEKDTVSDQIHLFAFMRELQQLGCRVALDNFGTGLSSLGKLQSMPVNLIKIDRCFISNICDSEYDQSVVKFLANLPLNLDIVCEGVETKEQLNVIKSLGVDMCQGYYLGKPLPENEINI